MGTPKVWRKKHRDQKKDKWYTFCYTIKEPKCSKCGFDKCRSALDFHHLGDKKFAISQVIHAWPFNNVNRIRMLDELNNCVVLCSNCHRELHHAT